MRFAVFAMLLVLADTCPPGTGPSGDLPKGTWGGENAVVMVSDTAIHVHIRCTYGNAPRPGLSNGRFEESGQHNVDAHPVDAGIYHPARFTGLVRGSRMTLTVTLTDTNATLGPVVVLYGQEPRMGPCPICRSPAERR
jgi:hypothetical protein